MNALRSSTALVRAEDVWCCRPVRIVVSKFVSVLSGHRVVICLLAVQFVEPIVAHISGSHCTDAINQLAATGAPFTSLEEACHEAVYKAILSTLMLSIVSYKKVPRTHAHVMNAPSIAQACCGVDVCTDARDC